MTLKQPLPSLLHLHCLFSFHLVKLFITLTGLELNSTGQRRTGIILLYSYSLSLSPTFSLFLSFFFLLLTPSLPVHYLLFLHLANYSSSLWGWNYLAWRVNIFLVQIYYLFPAVQVKIVINKLVPHTLINITIG